MEPRTGRACYLPSPVRPRRPSCESARASSHCIWSGSSSPYRSFQLKGGDWLIPALRQISATGVHCSPSFRMNAFCASATFDAFKRSRSSPSQRNGAEINPGGQRIARTWHQITFSENLHNGPYRGQASALSGHRLRTNAGKIKGQATRDWNSSPSRTRRRRRHVPGETRHRRRSPQALPPCAVSISTRSPGARRAPLMKR